ncbi:hypothetical protein HGRIS_014134 [Hohenbuehelia grisea]|uniref:Uncharacterized protein n=1 Tax=Hohenbuehelia grisea TaxID=104357 RepID=A0ABR3JTW4_9AGAR
MGFISDMKAKALGNEAENSVWSNDKTRPASNDPTFSIQPHPAKSNDPADLKGGNSYGSGAGMQAHNARGPHVPNQDLLNNLEQPLSREELRKRQAELNK